MTTADCQLANLIEQLHAAVSAGALQSASPELLRELQVLGQAAKAVVQPPMSHEDANALCDVWNAFDAQHGSFVEQLYPAPAEPVIGHLIPESESTAARIAAAEALRRELKQERDNRHVPLNARDDEPNNGGRPRYKLVALMAEMPEGLPRAAGWEDSNSRLQTAEPLAPGDVAALLVDLQDTQLVRGQVGTVAELLDDERVLLEFVDAQGVPYGRESVPRRNLLKLLCAPASSLLVIR